ARMAALRKNTPLVAALTPMVPRWLSVARGDNTIESARVIFTTAEAFEYEPKLTGESLHQAVRAFRDGAPAAVLNPDAADDLFGDRDPVGERVTIAGKQFTVVAVRPNWPGFSGMGFAWLPIGFHEGMKHRIRPEESAFMTEVRLDGRPVDERRYTEAMTQLRDALLPMLPEEYRKGIKMSEQIPETTKQFIFQHKAVAVRGAVGALAVLLVALIGLANMLLVSVHQGVRETGVRRA
ncbi:MAG: hypothetical protein GTN78_14790, partial [Gemmatimonadales bacterium]|nr:hypothetical protein [Gemmatimonadales bacterium]